LLLISVVRVAGPEAILDFVVVARALVMVLDEQADRGAGSAALEDAGEDAHLVALPALAGEVRGPGAAAIDVGLQVRFAQRQAGGPAVDNTAERRPVALAESSDREKSADRIA